MKVVIPGQESPYDQSLLIQREASILKDLGSAANDLYIDAGENWLLTRWLDAPSAGQLYKDIQGQNAYIKFFNQIIQSVLKIHQAGYTHGDLQPDHFIMEDKQATLIDWGLARYKDDTSFQYKGSLVHFTAPEVAKQMLEKKKRIEHDQLSEVYMLCSVLFFLYTGKTSTNYGTDNFKTLTLEEKLTKITSHNPAGFENQGALEALLSYGLEYDRKKRCLSIQELHQKLKKIRK